MKRTRLKSISPKRRSRVGKTGTVRLAGNGMEALRREVYFRDRGMCQLRVSPSCWGFASWEHGHLCHIVSRGAGGSDTPENTRWGCRPCHLYEHAGQKPCPPKQGLENA